MVGFIFRNAHSYNDHGIIMQSDNRTLLPAKRISEEVVLGRHGSYKFENGYADRVITVKCKYLERNRQLRRHKAREFALWLSEPGVLSFDDEPYKHYRARVDNAIDLHVFLVYDEFGLSFQCEPFAFSDPITMTENVTADTAMTIVNEGTFKSEPMIIIQGTADTISFSNTFSISNITKTTYIDCEKMLCYTEGKENKLMDFTGDFLELNPGSNVIDITGANMNLQVSITYRNRFL